MTAGGVEHAGVYGAEAKSGGRSRKLLKQGLSVLLLGVAGFLLVRELRRVDPETLWSVITGFTPQTIALALTVVGLSYVSLSLVDYLAVRHFDCKLSYPRVALTAFIAYTFNFNFGSLIGAVGLRYRLYDKWGLSPGDVARIVVYAGATSTVGYGMVAGLAITAVAPPVPLTFDFASPTFMPLGIGALAVTLGYLALCALRRRPLEIRRWHYELPSLRGALAQVAVASAQWTLMSLVVYVLLPADSGVSYPLVLSVHLIAGLAGVLTHVPGGLGVLEGTFLVMLGDHLPRETILGTMLAFRAIYYLLPLCFSAPLLFAVEGLGLATAKRR